MARVTVEDCLDKVENRFDLVTLAAHRAHQISLGGAPLVEPDNDKNPVIALREIASGCLSSEELESSLVKSYCQNQPKIEEGEEEELEALLLHDKVAKNRNVEIGG